MKICIRTTGTNFRIARFLLKNPQVACADLWTNQTGSGLYHPIVKEQVLPVRQEEQQTIANFTPRPGNVKTRNGRKWKRGKSSYAPCAELKETN